MDAEGRVEFDPDEIARAGFPTSPHGYEQDAVRRYLVKLAAAIGQAQNRGDLEPIGPEGSAHIRVAELDHEAAVLRARVADLEDQLEGGLAGGFGRELDEAELIELLGQETARIVASARSAAADITSRAERDAAEELSSARSESSAMLDDADAALRRARMEADDIVHQADLSARALEARMKAEADAARAVAEEEANRIRAEASLAADGEVSEARRRAAQIVADAEAERDDILSDLVRRRRVGQAQLEALADARLRFVDALTLARVDLDEMLTGVEAVPPSPAEIDLTTGDRRDGDESEVAALADHLDARRGEPGVPAPSHHLNGHSNGKGNGAGADGAGAAGNGANGNGAAANGSGSATGANGRTVQGSTGQGSTGHGSLASGSTVQGSTANGSTVPGSRDHGRPAPGGNGQGSAHGGAVRPAGHGGVPLDDQGLVTGPTERPGRRPVDPVGSGPAGWRPDPSAPTSRPAPRHDVAVGDTLVSEAQPAPACHVGHDVLDLGAVDQPLMGIDSGSLQRKATRGDLPRDQTYRGLLPEPFQVRDIALTRATPGFKRRLKRAVNDDQSDVLDRIRAGRGKIKVDELPPLADQLRGYVEALRPVLSDLVTSGVEATGRIDVPSQAVENLCLQLGKHMVDCLRIPTAEVIDADVDNDREAILDPVRAIYRDFRNGLLPDLIEDALHEAFAVGFHHGIDAGTLVIWATDPRLDSDPICEQNSASPPLLKGETFPSGHARPLSMPGCRCLVVPR
ncbi:MAG: hypothetical protein ACK5PP_07040 [Acidimicrobiales bacterium]